MNRDEYRDYLTTDHWRRTRQRALKERGQRCEACGSTRALHVHHRSYQRVGEEGIEDLRILCHACHQLAHDTRTQRHAPLTTATDIVITGTRSLDTAEPVCITDALATTFDVLILNAENSCGTG